MRNCLGIGASKARIAQTEDKCRLESGWAKTIVNSLMPYVVSLTRSTKLLYPLPLVEEVEDEDEEEEKEEEQEEDEEQEVQEAQEKEEQEQEQEEGEQAQEQEEGEQGEEEQERDEEGGGRDSISPPARTTEYFSGRILELSGVGVGDGDSVGVIDGDAVGVLVGDRGSPNA
jgi:hypothetical protein